MPANVLAFLLFWQIALPVQVLNRYLNFVLNVLEWHRDTLADFKLKLVIVFGIPALLLGACLQTELFLLFLFTIIVSLFLGSFIVQGLNTLLGFVFFLCWNMNQDRAFPVRCALRVAVHYFSFFVIVVLRATIEILPYEHASLFATLSNQPLDAKNQGANDSVWKDAIVVPCRNNEAILKDWSLYWQHKLLIHGHLAVDLVTHLGLKWIAPAVASLKVGLEWLGAEGTAAIHRQILAFNDSDYELMVSSLNRGTHKHVHFLRFRAYMRF